MEGFDRIFIYSIFFYLFYRKANYVIHSKHKIQNQDIRRLKAALKTYLRETFNVPILDFVLSGM